MSNESTILDGIGGVFLYANDPKSLSEWYGKHFNLAFIPYEENIVYGLEFVTVESPDARLQKATVFSFIKAKERLQEGVGNRQKINFRVLNLHAATEHLRSMGITIEEEQEYDFGRFAVLKDPEGNRIELYEPL